MLQPGDSFERYTVESVLGQGGMGTVYRALDSRLERRVALKVISEGLAGEDADARLLREARAAAALDHPNAVSIFDVGELDGSPYIVMELVSGRTLREAVVGSVPQATRLSWLADAARALAAAHKRGLVHRDIKPENVMVRDDGVVKVLDFGIARRARSDVDPTGPTQGPALPTLTKEGIKIGTPLYMAPEQVRGEPLDGRADQFSWGVLAFEILTGRLPWKDPGDPLAVVAAILTGKPDVAALEAAGVPAPVRTVLARCLARDPDERFASMDELLRALDAAQKGEPLPEPVLPGERAPAPAPEASGPAGRPASTTSLERYSSQQVRDILARAVEQEEEKRGDARLGFEDLVAAAREVGVEEGTLREASRELRAASAARTPEPGFEAWRRRKRRNFYRHLASYLLVNAAFLVLGLATGALFGTMQPALWWAIGLGMHAVKTFTADEDDYRDALAAREKHEKKKRLREAAVERAIEEGASALRHTGELIRRRIEQKVGRIEQKAGRLGQAADPRVRIAPPTPPPSGTGRPEDRAADDTAAEVEAEVEAELEAALAEASRDRHAERVARRNARREDKDRRRR
ncbi:MAG: protein kinase [Myxococcales bacterium]|nr:protein kinase [Myxococcales bacterium]